jgi:hypothetical protein
MAASLSCPPSLNQIAILHTPLKSVSNHHQQTATLRP